MKRSPFVCFALLALLVFGAAGCATTGRNNSGATVSRPRAFALAVTVQGTLQPTPQQWAMIQARFARALAARGWVLVSDISLADHIIRIDFVPDSDDPENKGIARIIGLRNNPLSTVARQGTSPYPSSAMGYSSSFMNGWPQSNFYSAGYYGYSDLYHDGYWDGSSTYTPVTTTPPTTPPHHHHVPGNPHPGNPRDDCPPPLITPPSGGQFAGNDPVNDHPRPHPHDYGRMPGEYVPHVSSARSDRTYSDSGYSRSNSSYSSPSYSSYESSYSSYSPPSSSYSTDTSSSMSNAATAASISSSAPAVGTVSSAH